MIKTSKNCILFFVNYPAEGEVKTRLAEQLGDDVARDLYNNFVTDTLVTLCKLEMDSKIVFDPFDARDKFEQWLGKDYSYMPQIGRDLGQKMKNAFSRSFSRGFDRVVIIGSDSPDLPAEYLKLAFTALDTNGTVIGPSSDGGYYLIGFTKDAFLPQVFDQISWGSDKVFKQTIAILKQHKRKPALLPQWYDMDTLADLDGLVERNRNTIFNRSGTFALANKIKNRIKV